MRGFIYRIDVDDKHYIGSSTLTPAIRFSKHKDDCNRIDRKKSRFYLYMEGRWDDAKISVIEENIETLKELRSKEYSYINSDSDKENSLNTLTSYVQENIIKNKKKV